VVAIASALHQAGLSIATTWEEVARMDASGEVPRAISAAIARGEPAHDAIASITRGADQSWRALGACWALARVTGAPLAPALAALGEALSDTARTKRQIEAALAGPVATMRLVMVLPVLGILGGALGGQSSGLLLFTTLWGLGLLVAGIVMMSLAWWWLSIAKKRALAPMEVISLELDLFATATGSGALPERASALVREHLEQFALVKPEHSELPALIALSRRAGVPVAALARTRAALERDRARTDAEHRLGRLGVTVVVPLGLLVLPAFVMVAIVPMAVGLWSGVLA
jgi:tight adherence protein B